MDGMGYQIYMKHHMLFFGWDVVFHYGEVIMIYDDHLRYASLIQNNVSKRIELGTVFPKVLNTAIQMSFLHGTFWEPKKKAASGRRGHGIHFSSIFLRSQRLMPIWVCAYIESSVNRKFPVSLFLQFPIGFVYGIFTKCSQTHRCLSDLSKSTPCKSKTSSKK